MRLAATCDAIVAETDPLFVDLSPSGTLSTYLKYGRPKLRRIAAMTPFGQDLQTLAAAVRAADDHRAAPR
jgi:hypothetical protein